MHMRSHLVWQDGDGGGLRGIIVAANGGCA